MCLLGVRHCARHEVYDTGDFSLAMDGFSDSKSPPGVSSLILSRYGISPTLVDSLIPQRWLFHPSLWPVSSV